MKTSREIAKQMINDFLPLVDNGEDFEVLKSTAKKAAIIILNVLIDQNIELEIPTTTYQDVKNEIEML